MPRVLLAVALIAPLLAGLAAPAAQELTGTLKKIKDSKTVTLGYRESSIPFSYRQQALASRSAIRSTCATRWSTRSRKSSKGSRSRSTTRKSPQRRASPPCTRARSISNAARRQPISSARRRSPSRRSSSSPAPSSWCRAPPASRSYRDLRDKTVVVTAGTTNEAAVRAISDKQHLGIKFVVGKDHAESFAMLKDGKADAFATDDVLLYGLVATTQIGRPVPCRRRLSVLRPLRADVPQGRSRFRRHRRPHLQPPRRRAASWCSSTTNGSSSACRPARRLDLPMSPQLEEILPRRGRARVGTLGSAPHQRHASRRRVRNSRSALLTGQSSARAKAARASSRRPSRVSRSPRVA